MNKKAFFFVMLFTSCVVSCAKADTSIVKGKFVFNSIRSADKGDAVYLLKDGKVSFVGSDLDRPRFSRDGKLILATSLKKNSFIILTEEGEVKETIPLDSKVGSSTWSPTGLKILYSVFGRTGEDLRGVLKEYDLNTKQHRLIQDLGDQRSILTFEYSPDGNRIAFYSASVSARNKVNGLFLCDADGSDLKLLKKDASGVMWFPDGKHVAYISNKDDEVPGEYGPTLFKLNIESGESVRLAGRELIPFGPASKLSRDGKYFYSARSAGRGSSICLRPVSDLSKMIWVTRAEQISPNGIYFSDSNPDWWQGG